MDRQRTISDIANDYASAVTDAATDAQRAELVREMIAASARELAAKRHTIYSVAQSGTILMSGTLAACYEAYPTLACVEIGKMTARGLRLAELAEIR